ncbi:MAG: NCS2 family permease [Negativicutes bacterium]|nr:NCS2 family permease [Negativicutes bacterium]
MSQEKSLLDRFFGYSARGSSFRTEIIAGLTTFMAMSYIIFVNPNILADAGVPKSAAIAATILSAFVTTLIMALWVNFPAALAPGMGLNAFFAYYVCGALGLPWQTALGAVLISGIVFMICTVTGIFRLIIKAVPMHLKYAIGIGIGLFIAFIGMKNCGIIVDNPATLVSLGDMRTVQPLMAVLGLVITGALIYFNVTGAMLIGIFITTIIGMIFGLVPVPHSFSDIFSSSFPDFHTTFMALDLKAAIAYGVVSVVFTFTMVEMFDNMGTLIGLSSRAKMIDDKGEIKNLNKALTTASVGTMISAVVGTPTVTTYVESATGVSAGGRTGLTALTVAIMFVLALLFIPIIAIVPPFATAPALILVGAFMLMDIRHIDFNADMSDIIPVFLTIIMMPLTYSIATGFAFGFVSYALLKLVTGQAGKVHWMMWIIAICFAINFYMRGS